MGWIEIEEMSNPLCQRNLQTIHLQYNEIRAGQDASGLSANMVTRSHISQALNQKHCILVTDTLLVLRLKETHPYISGNP